MLDKITEGKKGRSTPGSGHGQLLRETDKFSCAIFFPWKCLFVKCKCCVQGCPCQGTFQWTQLQNHSCFLGSFLQAGQLGREGCAVGWSVGKSAWGGKPHSLLCRPWPWKYPTQSEMLKISRFLPSMELPIIFLQFKNFPWKINSSFSLTDKS